jgi:GNAT superfamily N-acetyltransferase
MNPPGRVTIGEAPGDRVAGAIGVLEGAMLEIDPGRVRGLADGAADGAVLIATAADRPSRSDDRGAVLGTVVVADRTIEALAVRPRRRGQGIGSALVRGAGARVGGSLEAAFDPHLREFYAQLGFTIERVSEGRYRGRLD